MGAIFAETSVVFCGMQTLYFSLGNIQPFAPLETEEVEEGVTVVNGDGKIVGLQLADNRMVVRLDEIIEKLDLDRDLVWSKVHADDDALTGRRGDVFGGVQGR